MICFFASFSSLFFLTRSSDYIEYATTKTFACLAPLSTSIAENPNPNDPLSLGGDLDNSWVDQQFDVSLFTLSLCSLAIEQSYWTCYEPTVESPTPLSLLPSLITENLDPNNCNPNNDPSFSLLQIVQLHIFLSSRSLLYFLKQTPFLLDYRADRSSQVNSLDKYLLRP